jgi:hypothetical protein
MNDTSSKPPRLGLLGEILTALTMAFWAFASLASAVFFFNEFFMQPIFDEPSAKATQVLSVCGFFTASLLYLYPPVVLFLTFYIPYKKKMIRYPILVPLFSFASVVPWISAMFLLALACQQK